MEEKAMNTQMFCQSCGMPVTEQAMKGTEADGSYSDEFCTYCYQKGSFVQELSMNEMIEVCVPHMVQAGMPEKEARDLLASTLPNLSRWK